MNVCIVLPRIGAVMLIVSLAGCANMPPASTYDVEPLFRDALFEPPAKPVDREAIFAVNASMRRFLARQVVPRIRQQDARQALFDALTAKLAIRYDTDMTRTAAQTFAARKGNCLSLVIMAATLANELGIRVGFQDVYRVHAWSRKDGFAILSRHVNLLLGPYLPSPRRFWGRTIPMVVDFLPPQQLVNTVTRPVSRQTVVAMYLNNRAVEVMLGGDLDRAYWFARAALETDPGFVDAVNTLAIIYRSRQRPDAAERAMRYALRRNPEYIPALSNLAQMLAAQGRTAEARALAQRLDSVRDHPPFEFYDHGMRAMQARRFAAAAQLFEKALSRRPYDVASHFQLAVAAAQLGNMQRAHEQLELAMKKSTTTQKRALYAAKLRHLQELN